NIWTVSHGVVAVTIFTRQIQIAITRLNTDWTHNGVTRTSIRFLITLNTAGERIWRVVILAKQTEAVANFPLPTTTNSSGIAFITIVLIAINTFTADRRHERPKL